MSCRGFLVRLVILTLLAIAALAVVAGFANAFTARWDTLSDAEVAHSVRAWDRQAELSAVHPSQLLAIRRFGALGAHVRVRWLEMEVEWQDASGSGVDYYWRRETLTIKKREARVLLWSPSDRVWFRS
jgi:hypothetical protein